MKTLLSLFLSLWIAVIICLVLLVAGVLKYDGGSTKTDLTVETKKIVSRVSNSLKKLPNIHFQSTSASERKATRPYRAPEQASTVLSRNGMAPLDRTNTDDVHEEYIYEKSLNFLKSIKDKGAPDIEDRFIDFLEKDLGADHEQEARLVRMSFWKNFLTLQHAWLPGEKRKMDAAFAEEKELKEAGFAAMGLTLMRDDIVEAENRRKELERQLSSLVDRETKQ